MITYGVDKVLYGSVEERKGIARVPAFVFWAEIGAHEVSCDGGDGEVGVARASGEAVREVVILDPTDRRLALWFSEARQWGAGERVVLSARLTVLN